jgi:hypothetical protein
MNSTILDFFSICSVVINAFGNLIFWVFELCCFVINESGVCALVFYNSDE